MNNIKKIIIATVLIFSASVSASNSFAEWTDDWTGGGSDGTSDVWYDVTPPDGGGGTWTNWGTDCTWCSSAGSGSYYTPTWSSGSYYTPTWDTSSYYSPSYYSPTYYTPSYNTYTQPYNYYYNTNTYYPPVVNTYNNPQVCTQDAYVCPDGSTVGRTGPNCSFAACPTASTRTCADGRVIPSNQTCYRTCPNGTSVPETQSCPNTTRTCADGTVVNVSDICYRSCPNGVRVPETQSCPTVCADGTQAVNGICYRTCTDGSRVAETQSCPTPNRVCPDGSVVPSTQSCPTRVCSNGTTVPINQTCYRTCSNGTTVPEGSICYRTCPNGVQVAETNTCPNQTQTCWDGSVIPVTSVCPPQYKVCPNGTSVPVSQSCNRVCANGTVVNDGQICYRTCPNGASIPENQSCPIVSGFPWVDLRIDRTSVPFGGSAVLTWTSQNTTSCVASNGWTGSRSLQGEEVRYNITNGVTYVITCTGANGQTVSDSVSVVTGGQTVKVNNVITSIPTEITDTSARCNGIGLIANNANSNAWFEYGETQNLGRTTATANIGSAPTSPFSNVLASLKPNTTYYCRAVMANANGTVKGDIISFTTKAKKVSYVKPVVKTTTTVKKVETKPKEIICSDGTTVFVKNESTAQILAEGGKLVQMQLEKLEGDLSPGSQAGYRLTYRNVSGSAINNVVFKITLPQEFALLTASDGAYDKTTRTITVPMMSLQANGQGTVLFTVKVDQVALVGKSIIVPAVVTYTVPGTEGSKEVQDEVTAYVMGSIMPANGEATSTKTKEVKSSSSSFLPNSLIEWFALFAIILILMILGRSIYLSWKGGEEKSHH